MSAPPVTPLLRVLAVALAGGLVVSACTSLQLTWVPGTPPAAKTAQAIAATPSPKPSPTEAAQDEAEAAATKAVTKQAKAATDQKTVIRLKPRPVAGPFEMNLYRKGDFVHQATKDWCVAGSTSIMLNILEPGKPKGSAAFQQKLYQRGRSLSPNQRKLGPIGIDLIGWAALLNKRGHGPYVVEASATRRGAIRKAAQAIRLTGKPVGLVTWRGAHSWVMSGFTATADPAYRKDFTVKAVYIQDTWYPYVSTIWGASDPPNTLVPVGRLKQDYLPYARPAREVARTGRQVHAHPAGATQGHRRTLAVTPPTALRLRPRQTRCAGRSAAPAPLRPARPPASRRRHRAPWPGPSTRGSCG